MKNNFFVCDYTVTNWNLKASGYSTNQKLDAIDPKPPPPPSSLPSPSGDGLRIAEKCNHFPMPIQFISYPNLHFLSSKEA